MKEQKKKRRIEGMDALRGFAILGVVLYHVMPGRFPGGFLGVNMFLVLSGYLIYKTSVWDLEHGEYAAGRFYKKRCIRIYPPLLIMIVAVWGILAVSMPEVAKGMGGEVLSIVGGYNNFWQIRQNASYFARMSQQSPYTHLWAIAIEMQFYLMWPLLFWLLRKLKKHTSMTAARTAVLVLVILGGLRMSIVYRPTEDVSRLYYGTDTRIYALFLGMFIAMIQKDVISFVQRRLPLWFINSLTAAGLVVMTGAYFIAEGQMPYIYQGGMFADGILCALILLLISVGSMGKWLDKSPFALVGRISYELYLWMYPIIFLFGYYKKNFGPVSWCVQIILMVFAASAMHGLMVFFQYKKKQNPKGDGVVIGYTSTGFSVACIVLAVCVITTHQLLGDAVKDTVVKAQAMSQQQHRRIADEVKASKEKAPAAGKVEKMKKAPLEKTDQDDNASIRGQSITAIGDSVLLGASKEVKKKLPDCMIDAKVSRQVIQSKDIVKDLKSKGKLGDTVVLALGTNGTFSDAVGRELIRAIGKDRKIYWVTAFGEHLQWQEEANHQIRSMADQYKNVQIIDWASLAEGHPKWFVSDGVHLTSSGCKAYAKLYYDAIDKNSQKCIAKNQEE